MAETWGVVATVREHPDLLIPFVCHHLALGAARVWLYFDDPADPAQDVMRTLPGVAITACDAGHWARLGLPKRPDMQTVRQNTNFRATLANCDVAWLVHLDADEFLWAPDGVSGELSRAAGADWIAVPPAERIAPSPGQMFSGVFRGPLTSGIDKVYGPEARFLAPDGMAGHSAGKPMVPARTRWHPVTHKVMDGRGGVRPHATPRTLRLLHFEGLTPNHWALKHLRYALLGARAPVRRARLAALAEILRAPDPGVAARAMFGRLYSVTQSTLAQLDAQDALWRPHLGIEAALAQFGQTEAVDPSGARLDRALEPQLSAVCAEVMRRKEGLLAEISARLAKG